MLVSVLSVKGSPGVTTFAVALAALWPAPARTVLVEADPSGGDIGVRFAIASTAGLSTLATASRHSGGQSAMDLVWRHAQDLPGGLAAVTAPPDAHRAGAALTVLLPQPDEPGDAGSHHGGRGGGMLRDAANEAGTVMVLDCGRVDPGSPAVPLVRDSDMVVLLSRAQADDLAHLPRRLAEIGTWSPNPVLLLVGAGYPVSTVARELGVRPLTRLPHDPVGADALCGRPHTWRWASRRPARSALGRCVRDVAAELATQLAAGHPTREPATAAVPMAALRSVPGAPTVAVPRWLSPAGGDVL